MLYYNNQYKYYHKLLINIVKIDTVNKNQTFLPTFYSLLKNEVYENETNSSFTRERKIRAVSSISRANFRKQGSRCSERP